MWKLFSLIRPGRYEYGQRAKVKRRVPKVRRSGKRGQGPDACTYTKS